MKRMMLELVTWCDWRDEPIWAGKSRAQSGSHEATVCARLSDRDVQDAEENQGLKMET